MNPNTLLAELAELGVELLPLAGCSIRARYAPRIMTAAIRRQISAHKAGLLALLGACPACGHAPFDRRQRCCWKCDHRACVSCARPTGSAFVALCVRCGIADQS